MYSAATTEGDKEKIVYIDLYKDISNIHQLRVELECGKFQCCLIKAALVPSPFVLALTVNITLSSDKIKTKSIYSEILFNLSTSTNISGSLQEFGATDADQYVLALTFDKKNFSKINGQIIDTLALKNIYDKKAIQKAYKLTDYEVNNCLVDSVCNKIVMKNVKIE